MGYGDHGLHYSSLAPPTRKLYHRVVLFKHACMCTRKRRAPDSASSVIAASSLDWLRLGVILNSNDAQETGTQHVLNTNQMCLRFPLAGHHALLSGILLGMTVP